MRPCGSLYSLPMVPPPAKSPQVTVATYLFPDRHSLRSDTRYGYPSTEQCTSFSYRITMGLVWGVGGYSVLSSLQAIMNSEKIIKKNFVKPFVVVMLYVLYMFTCCSRFLQWHVQPVAVSLCLMGAQWKESRTAPLRPFSCTPSLHLPWLGICGQQRIFLSLNVW